MPIHTSKERKKVTAKVKATKSPKVKVRSTRAEMFSDLAMGTGALLVQPTVTAKVKSTVKPSTSKKKK